MCKFIKKLFKFIAVVIAIAGACAAVYFAIKKFMDKKDACAEDFVPCECCDCEDCVAEDCDAEEAPAEDAE